MLTEKKFATDTLHLAPCIIQTGKRKKKLKQNGIHFFLQNVQFIDIYRSGFLQKN
jgi:hypothetical protein